MNMVTAGIWANSRAKLRQVSAGTPVIASWLSGVYDFRCSLSSANDVLQTTPPTSTEVSISGVRPL